MTSLLLLMTVLSSSFSSSPPAPLAPVPTRRQLDWQKLGQYAFVHFGPNTFTGNEWGHGTEAESVFNPKNLDCRQWVRTFKKAGLTGVMITAKHHDGFCLWPSQLSKHTVAQSPWRDGKGDVLKDLSEACRAEGMKFGVYLSPWDRNHPSYGTPEYNKVFEGMLREVLTHYGPVFEVWFDGANGEGPNGKKQVYDWPGFVSVVRQCQPHAVIFSDAGPDIRWVGNEEGHSAPTCWSTIDRERYHPGTPYYTELTEGKEGGTDWVPAECDVSIRPGWFYKTSEDSKIKTTDHLVRLWEQSVGHNANLILNVPASTDGVISQFDVDALDRWHDELKATYGHDLAKGAHATADVERGHGFEASRVTDGRDTTYWAAPDHENHGVLTLELSQPATFDRVELREPIELGQRIAAFRIEVDSGSGWTELAKGTTVGNRRIIPVPATTSAKVRVTILDSRACPAISTFALYKTAKP